MGRALHQSNSLPFNFALNWGLGPYSELQELNGFNWIICLHGKFLYSQSKEANCLMHQICVLWNMLYSTKNFKFAKFLYFYEHKAHIWLCIVDIEWNLLKLTLLYMTREKYTCMYLQRDLIGKAVFQTSLKNSWNHRFWSIYQNSKMNYSIYMLVWFLYAYIRKVGRELKFVWVCQNWPCIESLLLVALVTLVRLGWREWLALVVPDLGVTLSSRRSLLLTKLSVVLDLESLSCKYVCNGVLFLSPQ